MAERKGTRKESLREKTARLVDIPMDMVLPSVTLIGDRELRLEHYGKVLLYTAEEIQISGQKWNVQIEGKHLSIRGMRAGELLITGWISALHLLPHGS